METCLIYDFLEEILTKSSVPFVIHAHKAMRTVEDMARNPLFDLTRIVKTVAFRTRNNGIVLAAVRGNRRVDYPRLAALLGINRRDLSPLSPEEVREFLGVEPGSVSPVSASKDAVVLIDEEALTIRPTLYCGIGRSDRTLEIAPGDLVQISGGRTGRFSR
jgi:Cys-tRNA(Pro)/Cys-tRNA(Cys) deacylase